jgi:hypothetical protein
MVSGAIIYISSFTNIGSGIQKLIGGGGGSHTARRSDKPTLIFLFQNEERRLRNCSLFCGRFQLLWASGTHKFTPGISQTYNVTVL